MASEIAKVVKSWKVSFARIDLEIAEAENDREGDQAVRAAIKRHHKISDELLQKLTGLKATAEDDVYELVSLARLLLERDPAR